LCQRLKLVVDLGPRYEPGAIAHVLPQVVIESAALGAIAQEMVPQGPLHDPTTADLVLRVQLQNLAPKGSERDRASQWFIYAASDLPSLLHEIGQFTIDHALPFFGRYRDVRAMTVGYEEGDERLGLDRRLCLYFAAAFLHIGQAEKSLRLMEARFGRPARCASNMPQRSSSFATGVPHDPPVR
jgi:hypothetical protein